MLVGLRVFTLASIDNSVEMSGLMQFLRRIDLNTWILILFVAILAIALILKFKLHHRAAQWIVKGFMSLRERLNRNRKIKPIDQHTLNEIIDDAGYAYDLEQDIFLSTITPWQRDMGYCRLYDEAAALTGMIIDCEPIYFNYAGKRWLIEFWKGQYGMTTGCEIGVYATDEPDINIPGAYRGAFYKAIGDEDLLDMAFLLKKNGKRLFIRYGRHWWLTGFKLGEFSEPSELTMNLSITFKNKEMRNAFIKGVIKAGYLKEEIYVEGKKVTIIFDNPRTSQPFTRTEATDKIAQMKNKFLCDKYQEITSSCDNFLDKINAIGQKAPEIYNFIISMGKTRKIFSDYEKIKNHLR